MAAATEKVNEEEVKAREDKVKGRRTENKTTKIDAYTQFMNIKIQHKRKNA